jgi:hypothetical protein
MTKAAAIAIIQHFSKGWEKPAEHCTALNAAATRTAFLEALLKHPLYKNNSLEVQRIMAEYDKP